MLIVWIQQARVFHYGKPKETLASHIAVYCAVLHPAPCFAFLINAAKSIQCLALLAIECIVLIINMQCATPTKFPMNYRAAESNGRRQPICLYKTCVNVYTSPTECMNLMVNSVARAIYFLLSNTWIIQKTQWRAKSIFQLQRFDDKHVCCTTMSTLLILNSLDA